MQPKNCSLTGYIYLHIFITKSIGKFKRIIDWIVNQTQLTTIVNSKKYRHQALIYFMSTY